MRNAVLTRPERFGTIPEYSSASRLAVAANLIVAFVMLALPASHIILVVPPPDFKDLPVEAWIQHASRMWHLVSPVACGLVAAIALWTAATAVALRRERRVVRKLIFALAPELNAGRLDTTPRL